MGLESLEMLAEIRGQDASLVGRGGQKRNKERTMGKDHKGTNRRKRKHPQGEKRFHATQTMANSTCHIIQNQPQAQAMPQGTAAGNGTPRKSPRSF